MEGEGRDSVEKKAAGTDFYGGEISLESGGAVGEAGRYALSVSAPGRETKYSTHPFISCVVREEYGLIQIYSLAIEERRPAEVRMRTK